MTTAGEILRFWFDETSPELHFKRDGAFDRVIGRRFADIHAAAARCELADWRETSDGRLAEVIVLDQFSRNLFRADPRAFASDPLALALAQEAIRAGADREMPAVRRAFLYMPFMHSESRVIHVDAERLFRQSGLENNYDFELRHKAIIDRFGRYPHRNAILGRTSTSEERAFLEQPGSSF